MAKPILISGVQTTGRLHIGNYLGMLSQAVSLQNSKKYQCYFFLADLHSLTGEALSAKEKHAQIIDLAANFLAAGLDPKKSIIFQQSQIPAHSELAWILQTVTPLGELYRMTQFKDKAGRDEAALANAGLLTYPALMAADIILYDAKFVPVGDDQLQHLELTRTLARKFNSRFGKTFLEPKDLLTKTPRIMSLADPTRKMSKSLPQGCLFLDDSPEEIRRKIMTAVTDSGSQIMYDAEGKPAISNLLEIYSALSQKSITSLEREHSHGRYGEFKKALAELVVNHFADFRKKKVALLKSPKTIEATLKTGSLKARKIAEKKMHLVKKRVGLAA